MPAPGSLREDEVDRVIEDEAELGARTADTEMVGRVRATRVGSAGLDLRDSVVSLGGRIAMEFDAAKMRFLPSGFVARRVEPEEEDGWRVLRRPALMGFLALMAVVLGASFTSSPFKLEMPGTWFFGEPSTAGATQSFMLLGLVCSYGGMILFGRVWIGLMRLLARRGGVPIKYLGWILALWLVPMIIVPPILSQDVFSYAAQGEMMSHHINPYLYGPYTLGAGPYVSPVNHLWANTPAPYGPLFLMVDGFLASVSLHNALGTVILLRVFAVLGVVLIAWAVPQLARLYGKDPGPIYVMAVLNPLVLLTLVGSAHNDAIMVGLLLAGLTLAKRAHPVWGVIVCALAAAIKVPAAIGIVYIGWTWMGSGVPWRQRVRPLITSALVASSVMVALSAVSGLGLGWIGNLATPGPVRSWLAPSTGIAEVLSRLSHFAGVTLPEGGVMSVTRVIGLMAAMVISLYLLAISDRIGVLRAMGLSLLFFVVLGPVVQPWYLTWGVILLAPIATGGLRRLLIGLSVVSPFIGLPGGHSLIEQLLHANPLAVAAGLMVLVGVFVIPLGRWAGRMAERPTVRSFSWRTASVGTTS